MKTHEMAKYEMLVRVRDFGENYGDLFAASTLAGKQFAAVAASVRELRDFAVDKRSTARHGVLSRVAARKALLKRIDAVRRTASAMAADVPDLENTFRMPARTDAALLTAGHQFLRDAAPLEAQFILHGLPPTFLANLRQLVDQFEASVAQWNAARGNNAGARKNIETALKRGVAALRKLDAIVPNQLEDQPGMLANWKLERRVIWNLGRRRSRKRAAAVIPEQTSDVRRYGATRWSLSPFQANVQSAPSAVDTVMRASAIASGRPLRNTYAP